ncbi:MAG TPA: hybrid sensor histidine kinase/response regulator, partial [Rubrivivax sp.]|nr:hybrid sensor histidine kinase/response regulator [Rubrivivax sp.]
MSLRVFAVLCVLVPLAIYAVVGAWRYQQLRAETDVRLDRSLRIAQEHALKIFEVNEGLLDRLAEVLGEQGSAPLKLQEAELQRQLRMLSAGKPQIHSLWIHDAEGKAIATDQTSTASGAVSVADRDYFMWHRQHRGGTFISGPLVGRVTGKPFFGMSRGRYLADGSFAGVIMVAVSPQYFESFYGNLVNDEPGMAITMLRRDGTILTRAPVLANAPAKLTPNSPVMSRIAQGDSEGVVSGVSSVDGKRRRLAFRQIGAFPAFVGTGMDFTEIYGRW